VLRHSPETIGLKLDEAGWAQTDELLACLARSGRPTSLEDLQTMVADNNKQRYSFSADGKRIRANQGHSIKVELGLEASVLRQCSTTARPRVFWMRFFMRA
jgi:putative RNA 2'-phosphotransferase